MHKLGYAFAALAVAGCASRSSEISASYVSPVMYQNHSCQQLAMEAQGVSARAAQVAGAQEQKRTNDAIATGVAIVVFWPAAFLVGGDGITAAELANLKGQMAAIEQASIQRNCGITFQRGAETGVTAPVYAPPPPVAAAPPSSKRTAPKQQARPVPPVVAAPSTVVAEPEPTLSEADRNALKRN
jgi:hypothetical protein